MDFCATKMHTKVLSCFVRLDFPAIQAAGKSTSVHVPNLGKGVKLIGCAHSYSLAKTDSIAFQKGKRISIFSYCTNYTYD